MSQWSLARGMAAFVRALRSAGVRVGPAESVDALVALRHIDPLDEAAVQAALKACLAKTPDDRALFDPVFIDFWHARLAEPARAIEPEAEDSERRTPAQAAGGERRPAVTQHVDPATAYADQYSGATGDSRAMALDLARIEPTEQAAMERLIRVLGQRLALRVARRWRAQHRGVLDMPASMRRALARGGEIMELRRRHRPRSKPRLVVLADISYSMAAYSRFFLLFIFALRRIFRAVDAYVFASALTRITPALDAGQDLSATLDELRRESPDWGGGTRIGTSIETYLAEHAERFLDRHTLVVIVSDGWDSDPPARLDAALARLRSCCRALIWLDPLLGHPRYFKSALGAQHDSPHVDLCAPARDLEALMTLADRLSRERLI